MKCLKKRALTIDNKVLIYLYLWHKNYINYFSLQIFNMITSFTQINPFSCFFWKRINNSVGFITHVLKRWPIRIRCVMAAPALLAVSFSGFWPQGCSKRSGEEIISWVELAFCRGIFHVSDLKASRNEVLRKSLAG